VYAAVRVKRKWNFKGGFSLWLEFCDSSERLANQCQILAPQIFGADYPSVNPDALNADEIRGNRFFLSDFQAEFDGFPNACHEFVQ